MGIFFIIGAEFSALNFSILGQERRNIVSKKKVNLEQVDASTLNKIPTFAE